MTKSQIQAHGERWENPAWGGHPTISRSGPFSCGSSAAVHFYDPMQVRAKYGASATPNRSDKEWVDERFVDYSRTSYGSLGPGGDRYVMGDR